jgi:hypothetical protein
MDYKTIVAVFTVILGILGYAPYIRDIFRGKTTPHVFSYFIWGFASLIIYALQVKGGAGVGSWVTLCASLLCIFIFFLGLRNGDKDITKSDIVFFILSLFSLFLWLIVKQPIPATILIVLVDVLGFIPTVRKSWNQPSSETLSLYTTSSIRHGLGIFALQQYNILTLLNPITWTFANALFAILLIVRRKQILK